MTRLYTILAVLLHLAFIISATPLTTENDNHAADLVRRIGGYYIVCDGGLNAPSCVSGGAYNCRCDGIGTYTCNDEQHKNGKACAKCGCQ